MAGRACWPAPRAGLVNGLLTVGFGLPAFIATLGMFYIARGLAAWIVAGQQLTGFPESYNLLGRKLDRHPAAICDVPVRRRAGCARSAEVVSVQTLWMLLVAIVAGVVLAYDPVRPEGLRNRRQPARRRLCRHQHRPGPLHRADVLRRSARRMAGIINVAYFRSFNPVAGQFRELDAIAAVIIGGGSIFGGYGTIIGALAGAAVITLIRALLQLNVITADGGSFVMPQHWVNVFIGLILIVAVLIDIWLRQANILGRLRAPPRATREPSSSEPAHA